MSRADIAEEYVRQKEVLQLRKKRKMQEHYKYLALVFGLSGSALFVWMLVVLYVQEMWF